MTTIGILGSGNVARALAGGLHAAGHEVTVGSRDPRGAAAARWAGAQRAGSQVTGSPVAVVALAEAAGSAEVVVSAIPGSASLETLAGLAAPCPARF
ncbi:NAD(P)-binding domain-containing protein [Actinomadura sp. HBU206391]|uniref:NAD(P)-binding domain-containing protein n=1 Tax=Actinomadura sp. HBU206391 TaxID=2731692 RepID=UPI00164F0A97|nr:NAD(P)-binding domain-containing protein [Actinomadura sp. HBU206391]